MTHTNRLVMSAICFALVVMAPSTAKAQRLPKGLLETAADSLNQTHMGAQKAVVRAVRRAVEGECHGSRMIDGDHYREATWALGSCELDAVALLDLAWEEGRFCTGGPPACPRGDGGHSAGTFQVQGFVNGVWDEALTSLYEIDLNEAAKAAYKVMRTGSRLCPQEPLAPYCGGCGRTGAREMAAGRLARAQELLAAVAEAP